MRWPQTAALCLLLAVAGCSDEATVGAAVPREPDSRATGYYCGMALSEHTGSYGQLLLRGWNEPLWFSSARDALTYMGQDLVSEDEIAGFWVNDMGTGPSGKPAPGTWVEAKSAWYVIASRKTATMGGLEIVPFKDRGKAEAFAKEFGGRIVAYAGAVKETSEALIANGAGDSP
ncbi:MAG: nitrous oxide reductase accessory protein NosL [Hyphomicrobium sp.]